MPAEAPLRGRHHARPVGFVGHVVVQEQGVLADLCGQCPTRDLVEVREHNASALTHEAQHALPSNAAGAAGDHGHFAFEPSHASVSLFDGRCAPGAPA